MQIPNCDLCRSHFDMIPWQSKKVMLRLVAEEPRKKDMKKFRTSIIFYFPTFSRQPNGMQERKSDQMRKRIHLKKKTCDLSCPPLGSKKIMRTTKWNSNPNEIPCKWTLTSYLYSILAVPFCNRDWGFGRRVSWRSGIPWIQAVWNAFCQKVYQSTKLTLCKTGHNRGPIFNGSCASLNRRA
jgi:hypothetical protein